MAIVETKRIQKKFGDSMAVDGVDLATREGEFLVLLGPSGCGKTTLLRMIAGLEHQSAGDVLIGGKVVNDLPPRARKIAMVFQSYALYPHMTVAKNIAFPLKAQGVDSRTIPDRVQRAAAMFGIQRLSRKIARHRSDRFMPPDISTGRHVDWFARAFEHHHFLDGWSIDGRIVHIFLKWNYSSSPERAIGRD